MPINIRRQLGKSQVESQAGNPATTPISDLSAEPICESVTPHGRRFLVVIDGNNSPVDEAETPQELANLPDPPITTNARWHSEDGGPHDSAIEIAEINHDGMKLLRDRTEFDEISAFVSRTDTKEDNHRTAILVKCVKERWTKHNTGPWPPELWVAVDETRRRGEVVPELRYPVVINDLKHCEPINSPEALQRLLELPEVPSVTFTTLTNHDGDLHGENVRIADVDWYQPERLEELAETEKVLVLFYDVRARKTIPRTAYVVKSLRRS